MPESRSFWRVFPWDPGAKPGEPFSASFVARGQTSGRFDRQDRPPVLYLAERPAHAIAEKLQRFRGRTLSAAHLREFSRPLALVEVEVAGAILARIADLTDPAALVRLAIAPDRLASRARRTTQAIAARIHAMGFAGLRCWSMLDGDWHTLVLFLDRARAGRAVRYRAPVALELSSPELVEAAAALALAIDR